MSEEQERISEWEKSREWEKILKSGEIDLSEVEQNTIEYRAEQLEKEKGYSYEEALDLAKQENAINREIERNRDKYEVLRKKMKLEWRDALENVLSDLDDPLSDNLPDPYIDDIIKSDAETLADRYVDNYAERSLELKAAKTKQRTAEQKISQDAGIYEEVEKSLSEEAKELSTQVEQEATDYADHKRGANFQELREQFFKKFSGIILLPTHFNAFVEQYNKSVAELDKEQGDQETLDRSGTENPIRATLDNAESSENNTFGGLERRIKK